MGFPKHDPKPKAIKETKKKKKEGDKFDEIEVKSMYIIEIPQSKLEVNRLGESTCVFYEMDICLSLQDRVPVN